MDYNSSQNSLFYLVDSILILGIVIFFRGTLTNEDVGLEHQARGCTSSLPL